MKRIICLLLIMFLANSSNQAHAYNIFVDQSGLYHDAGIPDWLRSLGNNVTTVKNYNGENLSSYDIVMDFGYDTFTGLNANKKAAYSSYLGGGGSLYLQGEKPSVYAGYDTILLNFISNDLGGGNITALMTQDLFIPTYQPYHAQTTTSSPVTTDTTLTYLFDYALGITDPGNGFFVVHTDTRANKSTWPYKLETGDWSTIIGFDYGDLSNYPKGKLITNFDVTYLNVNDAPFQTNKLVLEKVVDYLGADPVLMSSPNVVPEPSTFGLIGIGILSLVVSSYRRKSRNS